MYSSNQQKLRKYVKDRKIKEENEDLQQEIVDEQIAENFGLESKATKISELSKRVANRLKDVNTSFFKSNDILGTAINQSKLNVLFQKLKNIPDSKLSDTQKIIKKDLSNSDFKMIINNAISDAMPKGVDAIKEAVISILGGDNNRDEVLNMISKIDSNDVIKSKLVEEKPEKKIKRNITIDSILLKAINNNEFDKIIKEAEDYPPEGLNKVERKLQRLLKMPDIKDALNNANKIAYEANNYEKISENVKNFLTGTNIEEKALFNLLQKTNTFNRYESLSENGDFEVKKPGRPEEATSRESTINKINEFKEELNTLNTNLNSNIYRRAEKKQVKARIRYLEKIRIPKLEQLIN